MMPYRLSSHSSFCLRTLSTHGKLSESKFVNKAQSGKSNFEKDFAQSHIKTNFFQKVLLGLGSGIISISNPSRGDMIAVMGEVTGYQALDYMRSKMSESEEGKKILEEKPRISSSSVDLGKLKSYPKDTLGKAYSNFLEKYGYTPDTRNAVQFVDDLELAYIAQRYRESHDLIHTLLDMPTNMLGEVTVKWVEAIQFKLPMCASGALFGAVRLAPKFSRAFSTKPIIKLNSELSEKIESNKLKPRRHPGVTHLPRVVLPEDILSTIKDMLRNIRKQLTEEAEELQKSLHHRTLPVEEDEKRRLYNDFFNYFKSKIPPEQEWTIKLEDKIQMKVKKRLKAIVDQWKPFKYDKRLSLRYLMARAPIEYAVLKRVFNEICKRDKEFAPESLLDFGSGIGTVSWVAHELWGSTLEEYYCVDASSDMIELAGLILRKNNVNNEPYIKTVYFRQFFPATPRLFDIVVSSFSFFELPNCQQRLRMLTALWNDTKEYLVLIENGNNWGFKVITEARDFLLHISKDNNVECHIFAPCPHENVCPRLFAEGGKTPCNFFVHYKKFCYTASDETGFAKFCYVIFRKKPTPPDHERPCRIVRHVLQRHKHVVCKLCTNEGNLLDLFVTKSKHGKPAYRCMKASNWGDVLPGQLERKMIEPPHKKLISDRDKREMISGGDDRELISGSDVGELISRGDDQELISGSDVGELISDSDSESDTDSNSESDSESVDSDDKNQFRKR